MRDLAALSPADFEPLVGTDFVVGSDVGEGPRPVAAGGRAGPDPRGDAAGGLAIRLTEVLLGPERAGHRRAFSLRFRGPAAPMLESATHALGHEALAGLAIFLVPVAADPGGLVYEAVFT